MWEMATFLIGLFVMAGVTLPVVAIAKVMSQQKQIARLSDEVKWLQQRVQALMDDAAQSTAPTVTPTAKPALPSNPPDSQHNSPPASLPLTARENPTIAQPDEPVPSPSIAYPNAQTSLPLSSPLSSSQWSAGAFLPATRGFSAVYRSSPPSVTLSVTSPIATLKKVDESATSVVTSLVMSLRQWFFGENFIVRIGAIVLLVGVVLLLKLASQYIHVPIALRMALVAVAGLVVTGIGYKTSLTRRGYGLTLQGVGFAMIYLTVFTSFRLFHLLPSGLTFGVLAILAGLTVMFSVWQNALPLAILAFGGAFLAPILVSQPSGSVVMLFSYYLLLNIAVATIAHFRTWKLLNALSLAVTFGLAYMWGFGQYTALDNEQIWLSNRWSLIALLVAHIALYLFIAIRYSQQVVSFNQQLALQPTASKTLSPRPIVSIDAGLLFGTALLGFGLMAALLHDKPYHLALGSGGMSAVYLLTGFWLLKQSRQSLAGHTDALTAFNNSYQLLIEATLALGVGFLALVLPLALSATWLTIGWAVQGAALVWLGQRTNRPWTIWFGLALQVLSSVLILDFNDIQQAWFSWLDTIGIRHGAAIADFSRSLPLTVVTVGLWVSAYLLRFGIPSAQPSPPKRHHGLAIPYFTLVMAILALLIGIRVWVIDYVAVPQWSQVMSLSYALASSVLLLMGQWLHERKNWQAVQRLSRYALPLVMLTWLNVWDDWSYFPTIYADPADPISPIGVTGFGTNTVLMLGCLAVAKALGLWLFWRWSIDRVKAVNTQVAWGLVLVLMMTLMLDDFPLMYSADNIADELPVLLQIVPTVMAVLALMLMQYVPKSKPLVKRIALLDTQQVFMKMSVVLVPVVVYWLISANYHLTGQLLGFYLPIINPLDILLIAELLYLAYLSYHASHYRQLLLMLLGITAFMTVSSMLVRTFGYWMDTPTWDNGAWQVAEIQTGLTILWSILATVCMFVASKKGVRLIWFGGISLLTLVLFKLVLVDMSNTSAILRVVSFIGAGVLMLVIGYLAPLPPATTKSPTANKVS